MSQDLTPIQHFFTFSQCKNRCVGHSECFGSLCLCFAVRTNLFVYSQEHLKERQSCPEHATVALEHELASRSIVDAYMYT